MKKSMLMIAAALAAMVIAGSASAKDLNGAGGTAIYPVLAKWADAYKRATGIAVNYQAIGSGGGIQQITAKTVDFANSDKPLTHADLTKINAVQFPAVIISIVPVVNVPGIKAGEMVLDGSALADIYLGKIPRLVPEEWPAAGDSARIRTDAGKRRQPDRSELVGIQGLRRQAALDCLSSLTRPSRSI
jgi:phosphate transport system substrate-binding protein